MPYDSASPPSFMGAIHPTGMAQPFRYSTREHCHPRRNHADSLMLWDVIVVTLLAHVFLWPASFLCTQVFFSGQRQWYLISLVACIAFGMIGFAVIATVYYQKQKRDFRNMKILATRRAEARGPSSLGEDWSKEPG